MQWGIEQDLAAEMLDVFEEGGERRKDRSGGNHVARTRIRANRPHVIKPQLNLN